MTKIDEYMLKRRLDSSKRAIAAILGDICWDQRHNKVVTSVMFSFQWLGVTRTSDPPCSLVLRPSASVPIRIPNGVVSCTAPLRCAKRVASRWSIFVSKVLSHW